LLATERIQEVEDGVVLGYLTYSCLDCWDTLRIGFSPNAQGVRAVIILNQDNRTLIAVTLVMIHRHL
jgi:hypothetical protein